MAKTIDGKEYGLYVVTWDQAEGWDESFIAYLEEPYKGRWEGPLEPLLPLPEMRRLAAYNQRVIDEAPGACIDRFEEFALDDGEVYFKLHHADGEGPGAVDYVYPTYLDGHAETQSYPLYDVPTGWTWGHAFEQ